jgi:hypothetical protein
LHSAEGEEDKGESIQRIVCSMQNSFRHCVK